MRASDSAGTGNRVEKNIRSFRWFCQRVAGCVWTGDGAVATSTSSVPISGSGASALRHRRTPMASCAIRLAAFRPRLDVRWRLRTRPPTLPPAMPRRQQRRWPVWNRTACCRALRVAWVLLLSAAAEEWWQEPDFLTNRPPLVMLMHFQRKPLHSLPMQWRVCVLRHLFQAALSSQKTERWRQRLKSRQDSREPELRTVPDARWNFFVCTSPKNVENVAQQSSHDQL